MVRKNISNQLLLDPGGFHSQFPTSRLPTKVYDRQSYVMVISKDDDVLKFMKMHLNRYFSHVVVMKSYTEGFNTLKEREIDVIMVEINHERKATLDWVRRVGVSHRAIPMVVIDPTQKAQIADFPQSLVVGVISPPFDLDTMHVAIRRCLNIRARLRDLDPLLPPKSNFGELIRNANIPSTGSKTFDLINAIRQHLTEEIID